MRLGTVSPPYRKDVQDRKPKQGETLSMGGILLLLNLLFFSNDASN